MKLHSTKIVDTITSIIENQEKIIREIINNSSEFSKYKIEKDTFMPGWTKALYIAWAKYPTYLEQNNKENTSISCFFEFNGLLISEGSCEQEIPISLTPLNKETVKTEIISALRNWFQNKISKEPYGGFYDARCNLRLSLQYFDQNKKEIWEKMEITCIDNKRLEKQKTMLYDFIKQKKYLSIPITDIYESMRTMCYEIITYYETKLSYKEILDFYQWAIACAKQNEDCILINHIIESLLFVTMSLLKMPDKHLSQLLYKIEALPSIDNQTLHFICDITKIILSNYINKKDREYSIRILEIAKQLGCLVADEMLTYGISTLPKDLLYYQDAFVSCHCNDIQQSIHLKVSVENESAYKAMIQYITNLIKHGFPSEYHILFDSKVHNYLPLEDIKKTDTNNFWCNCSMYPKLFPMIKEYIYTICDSHSFYSDQGFEETIPVGGYATFALGLVSEENNDIIDFFMSKYPAKKAIAPNIFIEKYIATHGITTDNISTVISCLNNSMDYGYYDTTFKEVGEEKEIKDLLEFITDEEHSDYYIEDLVDEVWDTDNTYERILESSSNVIDYIYKKHMH